MDHVNNDEYNEIIECAKEIVVENNSHKYIEELINRLDWERSVGLAKIIDVIAMSEHWDVYIGEVKKWMLLQIQAISEELIHDENT